MRTQKLKNSRSQRSTQATSNRGKHGAVKVTPKQRRADYPLHKRLLLHPLSMFLFLCVGVFMGGWTYQVVAATIISSTVQAPSLKAAATIATPLTQAHTTSSVITVSGDCPITSYITLTVNGSFSGTAMCGSNGAYGITSSLYPGTNDLKVQAYNITDAPGPTTNPIQITYDAPVLPVATTPAAAAATKSVPTGSSDSASKSDSAASPPGNDAGVTPILLTSAFHFATFTPKQTFDWTMDLEGGAPPYVVTVDWGDGKSSTLHFPEDPVFHLHHDYTTPGYYPVIVKSDDSSGQMHTMQLAALITDNDGHAAFLGPTSGTGSDANGQPVTNGSPAGRQAVKTNMKWLFLAWPTYLIIVLMAVSFWLGEKQEFVLIRIKPRRPARR